jgi:hypothetical protein
MPFLHNVLRGRPVSPERLEQVAGHYLDFGGVSPINAQNRALRDALSAALVERGTPLPVYWGNRNWKPFLVDAVRAMRDDGVARAAAFVTSAYSSYSGCRQYLDDIDSARAEVGAGSPEIVKLRPFFNHPGFIGPLADGLRAARREAGPEAPILMTAHSIPSAAAATCSYEQELKETARLVASRAGEGGSEWSLTYQSRSGPAAQPWLEPDINDALARRGRPTGFGGPGARRPGTRPVPVPTRLLPGPGPPVDSTSCLSCPTTPMGPIPSARKVCTAGLHASSPSFWRSATTAPGWESSGPAATTSNRAGGTWPAWPRAATRCRRGREPTAGWGSVPAKPTWSGPCCGSSRRRTCTPSGRPRPDRPDDPRPRQTSSSRPAGCRESAAARTSGARCSPSPTPGPILPASRPGPSVTGTGGGFRARRCGHPGPTTRWGLLLARHDPTLPKHKGITAFGRRHGDTRRDRQVRLFK